MKRWIIRLSILGGSMVCGWFAIAEVQRSQEDPIIRSVAANDEVPSPSASTYRSNNDVGFSQPSRPAVIDPGAAFASAADQASKASGASTKDSIPPATNPPRRDAFELAPPAAAAAEATSRVETKATIDRYAQAAVGNRYPNSTPAPNVPGSLPAEIKNATPLTQPSPGAPRYPAAGPSTPSANGPENRYASPPPRATPPTPPVSSSASTSPKSWGNVSAAVPAAAAGATSEAIGRPGGRHQEGPQGPQMVVEKVVPQEIQVGKPTTFDIKVVNRGNVTAYDVRVKDEIPYGTRLLSTKPTAQSIQGGVIWDLGHFEPGEEKFVEVRLMPEAEGEVGSVASVTFATRASARTLATRPLLKIDASSAGQVMIGDQIQVDITVANLGSGIARDVVLFETLPGELRHPAGADLEFAVGDLAPKESRKINLVMTAARAGVVKNVLSARGEGSLSAETNFEFEIIAPQLSVAISGPRRRYLERQATYTVKVANPGTAAAQDIELVSRLPRAMQFVSANNAGHYDASTHAVYWSLQELPEGEQGQVQLVTLPTEAGDHTLRVESTARGELSDSSEETVKVEGLSALFFEVVDLEDPVEVGRDTAYEIRVLNQGTKVARNIIVAALLPDDLKPLSTEGPTQGSIQGNQVVFQPLPRLAPKADTTFTVRAQGVHPGDQRVQVQIQSDDLKTPVTKEESTKVYSDR
ncbi:MAG: hypothetical protein VXZ84_05300 [Planctomycetota bacterium]|nr:hypothetical protein [Planctomycetota bacterium]